MNITVCHRIINRGMFHYRPSVCCLLNEIWLLCLIVTKHSCVVATAEEMILINFHVIWSKIKVNWLVFVPLVLCIQVTTWGADMCCKQFLFSGQVSRYQWWKGPSPWFLNFWFDVHIAYFDKMVILCIILQCRCPAGNVCCIGTTFRIGDTGRNNMVSLSIVLARINGPLFDWKLFYRQQSAFNYARDQSEVCFIVILNYQWRFLFL